MAGDQFIQVAADGAGKKVRNLTATVVLPDGTLGTVYMQCVSIFDENGNAVLFSEHRDWQVEMLDELRAIRIGTQQILDAGTVHKEQNDLLETAQDYRATITES